MKVFIGITFPTMILLILLLHYLKTFIILSSSLKIEDREIKVKIAKLEVAEQKITTLNLDLKVRSITFCHLLITII